MTRSKSKAFSPRPDGTPSSRIDQVRRSWSENETTIRRNRAVVLQMALLSNLFPEKAKGPRIGSCLSY
jgi:hypothetical protein